MFFDDLMQHASNTVHSVLGVSCRYKKYNGDSLSDISVIFDKNKPVQNDYGVIAGYRVEASFKKDEIKSVKTQDEIVDPDGFNWRVNMVIKETSTKWYVDVTQV